MRLSVSARESKGITDFPMSSEPNTITFEIVVPSMDFKPTSSVLGWQTRMVELDFSICPLSSYSVYKGLAVLEEGEWQSEERSKEKARKYYSSSCC